MTEHTPHFPPGFIEEQKRRLLRLKSDLTTAGRDLDREASGDQTLQGEAREYEEDAQHLTQLELNGQIGESLDRRLVAIDRALAKIAEGTYGRSDQSGEAISVERLRAVPEAAYTLKEQQARDPRPGP